MKQSLSLIVIYAINLAFGSAGLLNSRKCPIPLTIITEKNSSFHSRSSRRGSSHSVSDPIAIPNGQFESNQSYFQASSAVNRLADNINRKFGGGFDNSLAYYDYIEDQDDSSTYLNSDSCKR
jgi:hypothetical protein